MVETIAWGTERRFTVGLTGGIACGKSTLSAGFAALGVGIVDADAVAREVVEPGTPLLGVLAGHFGTGILGRDGALNRRALRDIVFADPGELQFLNRHLHPAISRRTAELAAQVTSDYLILVVPLLFENHLEHMTDRILVANAAPEVQLRRTVERDGCPEEQARSIIAAQVSEDYRCAHADDLIHTDRTTLEELRQRVAELDRSYRDLASARRRRAASI